MNFFVGTIRAERGALFFVENDGENQTARTAKLKLTENQTVKMTAYQEKEVIFGIRPEDLKQDSDGTADPQTVLTARIEIVEPMGAETHLYLKAGSHTFVARFPGLWGKTVDHRIEIAVDMKKGSFFESVPKIEFCKMDSNEIDIESWQTGCNRIV